jgi:hypothetical protein
LKIVNLRIQSVLTNKKMQHLQAENHAVALRVSLSIIDLDDTVNSIYCAQLRVTYKISIRCMILTVFKSNTWWASRVVGQSKTHA